MTFVIKQDLAGLNASISDLQATVKAGKRKHGKEEGEHSENVVVLLQGKLAEVSMGFKDVLEVRTKNIQASRSRTEQFVASASSAASNDRSSLRSDSPLYLNTTQPSKPSNDLLTLDLDGRLDQQQQQQQMLLEQNNTYIDQRGAAIEAIESTIHELGSIFSQLANMVAEQRDTVQRIDANTEDVVTNVGGAQRELFKYYGRVSSNRWLMIRMFGVIIVRLAGCISNPRSFFSFGFLSVDDECLHCIDFGVENCKNKVIHGWEAGNGQSRRSKHKSVAERVLHLET